MILLWMITFIIATHHNTHSRRSLRTHVVSMVAPATVMIPSFQAGKALICCGFVAECYWIYYWPKSSTNNPRWDLPPLVVQESISVQFNICLVENLSTCHFFFTWKATSVRRRAANISSLSGSAEQLVDTKWLENGFSSNSHAT